MHRRSCLQRRKKNWFSFLIQSVEIGYPKSVREVWALVGAIRSRNADSDVGCISMGWWELHYCPNVSLVTKEIIADFSKFDLVLCLVLRPMQILFSIATRLGLQLYSNQQSGCRIRYALPVAEKGSRNPRCFVMCLSNRFYASPNEVPCLF